MIRVAVTWYPDGGERTVWTDMPQLPAVGDSVSLGDPDIPTMCVRHVGWCAKGAIGGALTWHAEISVGAQP